MKYQPIQSFPMCTYLPNIFRVMIILIPVRVTTKYKMDAKKVAFF